MFSTYMIKEKLASTFLLLGLSFVLVYFGYQMLYGNHGLIRLMSLDEETEQLTYELTEVREQRTNLETRIQHLRRESLDLDMLDERARAVLGYAHKNDLVINNPGE